MYLSRKWTLLAFMLLFICLMPLCRTHAYIDPGTGNYLLQLIVAVLFGALFAIKVFWTKVKTPWNSVQTFVFRNKPNPAK
jgi:hypothetical protein